MLDDVIIMDLKGNSLFSKCFETSDKGVDDKEKDHLVVSDFIKGKLNKLPRYEVNFRQFKHTKIAFSTNKEKNLIAVAISHNGATIKSMQQQVDLISKKFLEKYENQLGSEEHNNGQYNDFVQELVGLQVVDQAAIDDLRLKKSNSSWKKLIYNPFNNL